MVDSNRLAFQLIATFQKKDKQVLNILFWKGNKTKAETVLHEVCVEKVFSFYFPFLNNVSGGYTINFTLIWHGNINIISINHDVLTF